MERGKIYWYRREFYKHPFIYIEKINDERFIGCMITSSPHSEAHPQNIEMFPEHFVAEGQFKDAYRPVKFQKSNLVRLFLIKRSSEVNDVPCGSLSNEGLEYLDAEIKNKTSVEWESKGDWPEFHYELR